MKHKMMALTMLASVACAAAYAQSSPKPGLFIKGGFNLSNITINKNGDVDDNKGLASFHAGLMADLPLSPFFAIQPGVLFTGKGAKLESGNTSGNTWYRSTTRPYYVEIPVNAVVKIPLGGDNSFFFGAGPYLGIGVAGKNKVEGQLAGVSFSRSKSIEFSDDDPFTTDTEEGAGYGIMRRFDYGVNGTVGIQSKFALLSVNYGHGLAKLQSGTSSSENELDKYRVWSVSLGFRL